MHAWHDVPWGEDVRDHFQNRLENKEVRIEALRGREAAEEVVRAAIRLYAERRSELSK
jgi:inorganic pyrophosphatase